MLPAYLLGFYLLQIGAYIVFKWGSVGVAVRSRRWYAGFIGGNLFGMGSMALLMKIYEAMPDNCNLANVLATGGAFIGTQVGLAWVFHSRLNLRQWCGIALVLAGISMATLCGPRE